MNHKIELGWDAILATLTAIGGGLVLMWGQVSSNSVTNEMQDEFIGLIREDVIYIRNRVDEIAESTDSDG